MEQHNTLWKRRPGDLVVGNRRKLQQSKTFVPLEDRSRLILTAANVHILIINRPLHAQLVQFSHEF
jgi:hypothetical protein